MAETYHFKTNIIDTHFHKEVSDKDKYIVCTCAKHENDYLIEFVEHYLKLDFDKIIICDNNDDTSVESLLSSYIETGQVEIFNCRGFDSFQVQFYSMFATEGNYKWCGYFDADEFLELGIYTSIKLFLNTIPEDIDVVSFNWLLYGTNDIKHKRPGKIQDRFKHPIYPITMFKENVFIKSIVRGGNNRFQNCWFNGSHTPQCSNKVTYSIGGYYNVDYGMHTHFPLRYKCGYIKHYYTKSFDEWIKKSSRGWPDGTATLATSNFMICESAQTSIDNMEEGFFIHPSEYGYLGERMTKLLDEYDVFQIKNTNKQIYAVTAQLISLMKHSTNHTFIITEECPGHIDDTLFAIYMEYGFRTGNRVVYAKNQNEVWLAFLRYSQKENYYIVDLK